MKLKCVACCCPVNDCTLLFDAAEILLVYCSEILFVGCAIFYSNSLHRSVMPHLALPRISLENRLIKFKPQLIAVLVCCWFHDQTAGDFSWTWTIDTVGHKYKMTPLLYVYRCWKGPINYMRCLW